MSSLHARSSAAILLACLLTACGGGSDPAPTGTPTPQTAVTRLELQAAPDSLGEAEERQYGVAALAADGRRLTAPSLTWTSSDTTVLVVSAQGAARGVRPGRATLRVAAGGVTTEQSLRVYPAPLSDIRIRGADSVVVGATGALIAEPVEPTGRVLLGRTVTWAVADTTIARVSADGAVRGLRIGRTEVVATSGSVSSRRALVVRGPYAASLAFVRVPDTLFTSVRDSVRAAFTDSAGRAVTDGRPVTYSTDAPTVIEVQADGRIRPLAVGTATLRASGDRLTATRQVTVLQAPVSRVVVAPETLTVRLGTTAAALPILIDLGGERQYRRAVQYAIADGGVASVTATGTVRGLTLGTTTLRVTSERGVGTAVVRVVPAAQQFRIDLRFTGASVPQFEDAFRRGVTQWEQAILRGGPAFVINVPANACGNTGAARVDTVQSLLIFVQLTNIDGRGGVLGSAGPCFVRPGPGGLPGVGQMTFDTTDLRALYAVGTLQATVTHEIGHVLGVGTIWNSNGRSLAANGAAVGDPRYFGRRGVRASAALGFSTLEEGVPLEDLGGGGTRGGHWNEIIFGNELMTGFINADPNPLSLLTVESLGDLGYEVAASGAEPFGRTLQAPLTAVGPLADRLPGVFGPAPAAASRTASPHTRLLRPIGTIEGAGRVRYTAGAR
jgi:hypothetical protein